MRVKVRLKTILTIPFFFLIFLNSNLVRSEKIISNKKVKNHIEYIDKIDPPCFEQAKNSINKRHIKPILEIKINNAKKWHKNLFRAKIAKSNNISKKYKKRFKSNILLTNNKNEVCILPARIRISGDWKDHIDIRKDHIVSSMDVHLDKGNINGIVNFKLFLPKTRRGDSEVLTALILSELDQLSPRTSLLKVNVNGKEVDMIMQEKPRKEFLENNRRRESALIGVNESVIWNLRAHQKGIFRPLIFSKVINHKWTKKNQKNFQITLNGMKLLSRAIIENFNHDIDIIRGRENSFSDNLLANNNQKTEEKLSLFRAYVLAMGAEHSLVNHNRRFYYDPFENSLLPIYYDGNSKLDKKWRLENNKNFKAIKKSNYLRELSIADINNAIRKVKEIDLILLNQKLSSVGLKFKNDDLEKILENILFNLEFLKSHSSGDINLVKNSTPNTKYIYQNPNFKYGLAFSSDGRNYQLCENNNFLCKKIFLKEEDSIDILRGKYSKNNKLFYYGGENYQSFLEGKYITKNKPKNKLTISDDIEIFILGNPQINVNESEKLILINTFSNEDKIVINESKMHDWSIYINGPKAFVRNISNERSDENLITSLLTIQDSILKNINITIQDGVLEDSLNLIRSEGNINKIKVLNSHQDAIDFDFSDLVINEIIVEKSGNDCLDLSYGNYMVKNLTGINCKDKGVSAGEASNVKIETVKLNNIYSGLTVKDSSKLYIKNANIENYNICMSAYRKKQEFDGAILISPKNTCSKESMFIQKKSSYIEK